MAAAKDSISIIWFQQMVCFSIYFITVLLHLGVHFSGNHSTSSTVSGTESNTVNQSIVNDSQNHPEPSHNLLCSASMNPANNVATQSAPEQPVFVTTVPVSGEGQSVLDGNQAITTEGEYMYYQQVRNCFTVCLRYFIYNAYVHYRNLLMLTTSLSPLRKKSNMSAPK